MDKVRKGKVVTFGEIMARIEPKGLFKFIQTDELRISYAGAEANVCAALAMFGEHTSFVTKLPDNVIARSALARLRMLGADVSDVTLGGERMGVFYLERGASQRPPCILYDRKYSSMSQAASNDFNWDHIFEGAVWFHFTGITAAIGPQMPAICEEACKEAKKRGISISCDINYRHNLWEKEEAATVMKRLVPYVDLLLGGYRDATDFLDCKTVAEDWTESGVPSQKGYAHLARQIQEQYGCKEIIFTLRQDISASDNKWAALLYSEGKLYFSKEYLIHLVDRIGGGDSLCAGAIYACLNRYTPQQTIEFAAAASCLKQTTEYDFCLSSVDEVLSLVNEGGTGRIQR